MIRSRDGVLHLGPQDEGLELDHDAFATAAWEPGYRYELVAGRLAVTPAPNLPNARVERWFDKLFLRYAFAHPDRVAEVFAKARVITRALGAVTDVEPDVTLYRTFPADPRQAKWQDTAPFLVVEVLSESDPAKDLVRNRQVYGLLPSIEEYWIVDPRAEPAPSMLVLARAPDGGWLERPVPPGGTYRTDLLPDLEVDLSRIFPGAAQ
ncbi:MAG: Uma2 family endonuclease [Planctomycetes bacterium]|nr:Uma2 family endonuclease [Planctomycetota bacterium]